MIIKSLVIKGFKGFYDEYSIDFNEDQTIIEGENFQGKTTIGEAICWCLLGCNLFGNEKTANLINNNCDTAYCKLVFLDNENQEHILYRSKGKENSVILDNHKADSQMLSNFYVSKKIFLAVYNPYYFNSLEPREQRDLLRGILPSMNYVDAFNLLDESEKNILVEPIIDLNSYTKNARSDIKELEKEEENFLGRIQYANSIINGQIEQERGFDKESYLCSLEKEYNSILMDSKNESKKELQLKLMNITNAINQREREVENIEKTIEKINKVINELDNSSKYCPYCHSKIDNLKAQEFKNTSIFELNNYESKKESILNELKELRTQKSIVTIRLNFVTDDKDKKLEILKQKIKELRLQREEIQELNVQIKTKKEAIEKAKEDLKILEKALEENRNTREILKTQIEIVKSLNMRIVEKQLKNVEDFLDKVQLIFYKIDNETGEIKDDYKILYDGKEYNVLSLSEKIRASLEISNLINHRVGGKLPVFIDNSESITHYNNQFENQVIFAKVVPKQKLRLVS